MVNISETEVLAWLTPLLWPFLRTLALFSTLPVLGTRTVPLRVRVALAAFIALAAQASLPAAPPPLPLDSPLAFMLVVQQLFVGLALGFSVRVVFAAIEFAGEVIGLQMGLNFAGFFDPATASQATASGRFLGTMTAWLFIVGGGHLLVIAAVVQSFAAFPADGQPLAFLRAVQPYRWGAEIFALGLWIALPLIAMLLTVNLVLGVISRVASQINVFSVGFPITLGVGLLGLLLTLPALQNPLSSGLARMLALFQR
ncbi:MAG: flagellar biosynthetic protein FliR [Burkholderiales bacterium]|nr:flagellar biosynthetic protein FliR [Burkholderiales bacterium]